MLRFLNHRHNGRLFPDPLYNYDEVTAHYASNLITAVINGLCSSCIVVANWLVVFDIARIKRFSERSLSVPGVFWTLPRSSDAALLCCFLSLGEYQPLCPAWLINLILREFLALLRRFVFDTPRHKLWAMHYIVIASSLQGNNIDNSWASSQVVLAIWILDILLRFVECMDYSS